MKHVLLALPLVLLVLAWAFEAADRPASAGDGDSSCVTCHEKHNPGVVAQWRASKHATTDKSIKATCEKCHGSEHNSETDAEKATMPTAKTCKKCHMKEVKSFGAGKHALAELAVTAIPMFGRQPEAVQKMGCGTCHGVGKRWEDGSVGRCDSCHTRHAFSAAEARRPEACETCHMGEDHSQYEMWRSSKHGVVHHLDPAAGRAPVCQDCHMQKGDHAVMTGWGFLGLRLPVPDATWQEDTTTIVKAIGPWGRDEKGMEERVGAIKALELARLDEESFQAARAKMVEACARCHSARFGKEHLERADQVIKETTHLMARAVRVVEGLYDDGVLPLAEDGPKRPDLLLFYDSPTEIEQELYRMFLFHRQKAFQGAIHANPDYMHWYGWAPMKSSMQRIEALAKELREKHKAR
jgi:hydroxylamine dehydrogenase